MTLLWRDLPMEVKQKNIQKSDTPARTSSALKNLREEMNHVFDRFSHPHWPHFGRRRHTSDLAEPNWALDPFVSLNMPSLWDADMDFGRADFSETDAGYELQLDLPGMKKEDIQVQLSDGLLTISGERSDEHEDKRKGYYLSERSYGSVRRSFRVPETVRLDDMKAQFNDGVLTLTMPKSEESQNNARKIEVE
ncbi:MAG: Hsp20/alpha crystallin family protein [Halomonadaceae bacterium]|nr:MAG: Hsp20/alpha crystallin family protein [Halomonadaceae bacterium]